MTSSVQPLRPVPAPKGLEHAFVMNQAATYTNAAVTELAERYGEIFVFGFGPIRFHWLVGAEALAFVLTHPENFSLKRAYSFLQVIGGDTALITSDEPEHVARRRLVQPAFHGRRVAAWAECISERNAAFFETLPGDMPVNLHARIKPHILSLITELLLGSDTLAHLPALQPNISAMMRFANSPFLAQQLKVNLPGTPWQQFLRARAKVDHLLYKDIARRKTTEPTDDILGMLLEVKNEAGDGLSDVELRDQAVSLVSAGFETTTAALTWAVYLLLEHPNILHKLRDEVGGLGARDILKNPYLDAVIKETLRLYPTAPAGLRQTVTDVVYKDYLLPEGSLVAYSIYATHRQEEAFAEPLKFRPERWLNGFAPAPFTYLPFGYGARYCIGAQLATTLIKLSLAQMLGVCGLEPAWTRPIEETGNTVQPKGGLPVRVTHLR